MNLLLIKPNEAGYSILAALRPQCREIVAVLDAGQMLFRWSQLYDHSYPLPLPKAQWKKASHAADNLPDEEAWIERVLEICRTHRIDVIWPADDEPQFLISRNRARFVALGCRVVAPDFATLLRAIDKQAAVLAAQAAGFPCPATMFCTSVEDVLAAAGRLGLPVVLKARFSKGSLSVAVAYDAAEVRRQAAHLLVGRDGLIVQEYIPGGVERSFHVLLDRELGCVTSFVLRKMHHLVPSYSTAIEVVEPPPELPAAVELIRSLGLVGFSVIQTKRDPRDGRYKLVEINPRFGQNSRILFRLWPDLPALALAAMTGPVPSRAAPVGAVGVSPVEDLLAFVTFAMHRLAWCWRPNQSNPPPGLREMLGSYRRLYRRRPRTDLCLGRLLRDPQAVVPYFLGLVRLLVPTPERFRNLRMVPWGDI